LFKINENLLYGVTSCADSEYAKQKKARKGSCSSKAQRRHLSKIAACLTTMFVELTF